jgi:hypothetical protein
MKHFSEKTITITGSIAVSPAREIGHLLEAVIKDIEASLNASSIPVANLQVKLESCEK